jgi:hypothetical protein
MTFAVVELLDRALHWIDDRWNARTARAQPDEVQLLLALLCEQLHERLEREPTPPRTVINLTAGQWHEITKR